MSLIDENLLRDFSDSGAVTLSSGSQEFGLRRLLCLRIINYSERSNRLEMFYILIFEKYGIRRIVNSVNLM